jgi:hypothetical protein
MSMHGRQTSEQHRIGRLTAKGMTMKMRFRLIVAVAAILVALSASFSAHGKPPAATPDKGHTAWVEKCLKDFESVKAGMTRHDVDAKWTMDGGIQGVSPVRYAHPACPYFKIDVEFDFKKNAADQNRAITGKDDKVTRVSKPYIERPFLD